MLWIANKTTANGLMEYVVIPSIACFLVPFALASRLKIFKGNIEIEESHVSKEQEQLLSSSKMLYFGFNSYYFRSNFQNHYGSSTLFGNDFQFGSRLVILRICSS